MDSIHALIGAILFGVFAFLFNRKAKKKKKKQVPPKSGLADTLREDIQETFEEEVDRVEEARVGADPATALADLGNARRRRK